LLERYFTGLYIDQSERITRFCQDHCCSPADALSRPCNDRNTHAPKVPDTAAP
jgi:hypothetical protein